MSRWVRDEMAEGRPLSWYAVHTRSNFEKRVAGELHLKGMAAYLPAVRECHQWKDRRKMVEVPLFPGYVFLRGSGTAQEQLAVLKTAGAVRILGRGTCPEAIPDREIEAVRILVNSGRPLKGHPFLTEGGSVFVTGGPLKGVYGVLLNVKNSRRLIVSIQLLSQSVAAEIDTRDVELIEANGSGRFGRSSEECIQI